MAPDRSPWYLDQLLNRGGRGRSMGASAPTGRETPWAYHEVGPGRECAPAALAMLRPHPRPLRVFDLGYRLYPGFPGLRAGATRCTSTRRAGHPARTASLISKSGQTQLQLRGQDEQPPPRRSGRCVLRGAAPARHSRRRRGGRARHPRSRGPPPVDPRVPPWYDKVRPGERPPCPPPPGGGTLRDHYRITVEDLDGRNQRLRDSRRSAPATPS